jgi:preprotein translocase subunit SecF
MKFLKSTHIDFIGFRKYFYGLSVVLMLMGIGSIVLHRGLKFGIDFKGGTSMDILFHKDVDTAQLRTALDKMNLGESEIKTLDVKNEFLIYMEQQKGFSASELLNQVKATLNTSIADSTQYTVRQVETVGPKVGKELRKSALIAVLFSLLMIMAYLGWRYELVFSVGGVLGLFHDVFLALGVLSLCNYQITMKEIAAFLTIVGYSINDTIVVYDRIRENMKIYRNEDLRTIINRSVNETLSRTIITALTVFLVVVVLFFFGGPVVRGFSLAMMVGAITGCYSSIYIAGALAYDWHMKHDVKRAFKMSKIKRS